MVDDITSLEYDFLMEVLTQIEGIGKTTAARIITSQNSFPDFQNIDKITISEIKSMNISKAEVVMKRFKEIEFTRPVETLYTEEILRRFLGDQYRMIKELKLENLDINALLVKALGFTTVEETIEFYLYQRITRSAVTSWGQSALEKLCLVAGAERIPNDENVSISGKRFDIKKLKDGKTYYIQVKSGPNTMNIGMIDSLNDMIEKIEEKHENAIGMLGMTYGIESQVSSQIKGSLNDFENKALIGSEFWDFLSDEANYFKNLISLINELSKKFGAMYDYNYLSLVKNKIPVLVEEWKLKYGGKGKEGLDKFLNKYTE